MTDVRRAMADGDLSFLDDELMTRWTVEQRWFGSKARDVSGVGILEALPLGTESPLLALALVESRFPAGTHELYQVLIGARPAQEGWSEQRITDADGWTIYDALADPAAGATLARLIERSGTLRRDNVSIDFHGIAGALAVSATPDVRAMDVEQSNTSIVLNERLALKVFRRLSAGVNPELEMLRFLSARGFGSIATLHGWYERAGEQLQATLGILQEFVHGSDGWELALDELGEAPDRFLGRLGDLGAVTGHLHSTLGSDASDSDFAPEEPTDETLSLLTATIDEEIERVFTSLPDDPALGSIAGRAEDVRARLQQLFHAGAGGRLIRTHGDYHLGQTLLTDAGWVILDFEGEPARSIVERRRKRSPLRDVAGMLRSFAYAVSASAIQRGVEVPDDWEERARNTFLSRYLEEVDPALLPAGVSATMNLLAIFELEKAVYELSYELNNRPDWIGIPVAGIHRLLEAAPG